MTVRVKQMVKRAFMLVKKKRFIPILQSTDPDKLLSGKVALLIGGTGGIGLSIARAFVESGCRVIICGSSPEKIDRVRSNMEDANGEVAFQVFDLQDFGAYEDKIGEAASIYGCIDILVCSAGVHSVKHEFWNMMPEEYDRVMDINLKAPFFLCQKFAKYRKRFGGRGHILLISSSRGSEPAYTPYGVSKWGLNGLTRGLAQTLLSYGIVVNAIAPGATATPLIGIGPDDSISSCENRVGRLIMPAEVAQLVRILVSDLGNMIVGETIHISGGRGVFDIR